jgi:hypothetical protein
MNYKLEVTRKEEKQGPILVANLEFVGEAFINLI